MTSSNAKPVSTPPLSDSEAALRDAYLASMKDFGGHLDAALFEQLFEVFLSASMHALNARESTATVRIQSPGGESVEMPGTPVNHGLFAVQQRLIVLHMPHLIHRALPRLLALRTVLADSRFEPYLNRQGRQVHIDAPLIQAMASAKFETRIGQNGHVGFDIEDLLGLAAHLRRSGS